MDDLAGLSWPNDAKKQSNMNSQRTGAFAPNYSPSASVNPSSTHKASQKDDPFGELVSFSGSLQKSQSKMSLRERQQMLENEQSRSSSPFSFQQTTQSNETMFPNAAKDTWNFDAFDSISTSRSATPMQQKPKANVSMDFDPLAQPVGPTSSDMGFGMPTHSTSKVQEAVSSDDEPIPMDVGQRSEPFADTDFEIAQVAGYGFSVKQAKAALEITGSPRAAIKLLREQTARNVQRPEMQQKPQASRSRLRTPYREEPSHTSYRDEPSHTPYRNEPSHTSYRDEPSHTYSSSDDDYPRNRNHYNGSQQTAQTSSDSFLATANGLGTSMMKQANSWFAMGKKKFMEIQESVEQRRWPGDEAKWNPADFEPRRAGEGAQRYRDYSDSSSDDEPYVSSNRHTRPVKSFEPAKPVESRPRPAHADAPIMDMMSDYNAAPAHVPKQPPSQSRTPASKQPSPTPIPTVAENILVAANLAKTSANEQFKLGQFGEAVSGYSVAIGQVVQHSDTHPVLIVLLNNRALAYARNGEAKMAVSDCTQVLQLSDTYQANNVVDLGQIGQINVGEQRAKALQRRAEAYETNERYEDGLSDWKALREIARDAAMRQQSTRGVQRCEKVLGIGQPVRRPTPAAAPAAEDLANVFASISISTVKSGNPTILTSHTENSVA
ncbi:auxilin-like clathrin-binding protein required for normal clathrin function, partial [Coemansia sp. RSA 521]